jgi:hypothetical protein
MEHDYKKPSMDPIAIQKNPVRIITPQFFKVYFNIILPLTPRCLKWVS